MKTFSICWSSSVRSVTKRERPHRFGIAWWTERDGCVWFVRRPAKGLLGGMAALPGDEWGAAGLPTRAIATVAHGFTHFTLDLAIVARAEPVGEGWWQPIVLAPEPCIAC